MKRRSFFAALGLAPAAAKLKPAATKAVAKAVKRTPSPIHVYIDPAFDPANVAALNRYSSAYYHAVSRGNSDAAQMALGLWNNVRTITGQPPYIPTHTEHDLAMNAYHHGLAPHPDSGIVPGSYPLANTEVDS